MELRVKRRFLYMVRIFLLMIGSVSSSILSSQQQARRVPSLQSLAAKKFVKNSIYLSLIKSFDPTNLKDIATLDELDNLPEDLYQLFKQEFFRHYGTQLYTFLIPQMELIYSVGSMHSLMVKPLIKSPYFIFYNQTSNTLYAWDALANREVNKIEFPKNIAITDLCALTDRRVVYVYNNPQLIEHDRMVAWDVTTNTQSSEITLDEDVEKIVRINDRVVGVLSESANARFFEFPLTYNKKIKDESANNEILEEDSHISDINQLSLITVPQDRAPITNIVCMNDSKVVLVCGSGYLYTIPNIYNDRAPLLNPINTHFHRPRVARVNDHAIAVVAEKGRVLKIWDVNSRNQLAATSSGSDITQFFVLNEESIFIKKLHNYYLYSYQEDKELARQSATLTLKAQWLGNLYLIGSIYQLNSSTLLFTTYAGDLYLQSLNENKTTFLKSQFQQKLSIVGDNTSDMSNLLLYSFYWYQYGSYKKDGNNMQALYRYNWQFDQIPHIKQWVFLYMIAYAQASNRRWTVEQKNALLQIFQKVFSGDAALSGIGSQIKWYIEHIIPEIEKSEVEPSQSIQEALLQKKRYRQEDEKGKEPMTEQENYAYEQELQRQKRQKQDTSYTSSDEE